MNVGCGRDRTVRELAEIVRAAVGCEREVDWDPSRPDGMPRKLIDVSRLSGFGWRPRIDLAAGIGETYEWYRRQTGLIRFGFHGKRTPDCGPDTRINLLELQLKRRSVIVNVLLVHLDKDSL